MAFKYYVTNSNLFIGGGNAAGQVKSFEFDNIKTNVESYESLGQLFHKDVVAGMAQMEGKLTFAGPAPDFFHIAANPWKTETFVLLGVMIEKSASNPAGNNQQLKIEFTARPKEVGVGKYENQKLSEFERAFMIDKITITMGGVEKLHADSENNIFRINGTDEWLSFNTILGQ